MRFLAGCVLLLAAAVAFPQTATKTDYLHGDANSSREFEPRPGIDMGVVYGSDGNACRADMVSLPWSKDPRVQDTMPLETVNSILDEISPPETRGTLVAAGEFSRVGTLLDYERVSIRRLAGVDQDNPPTDRVVLASVEFIRDVCARINRRQSVGAAPIAGAAPPSSAPSDDPLIGPANTYQKYEIRPGITLGVLYHSDGRACHADITPLHGPMYLPNETPRTISMNTIDSILDEILPANTYGKRVGVRTLDMSCASVAELHANGATIKITECPLPHVKVEEVAIDFDRPICHSEIHQNN